MVPFVAAFADELTKTAGPGKLVAKAIGESGSPLRKALLRAAALGATTATAETALQPDDEGKSKHWLRNAATGAATGAIAGRSFPAWFSTKSMIAEH